MISVILVVKDGGDDLRRCLERIERQVLDREARDGRRRLRLGR